MGIGGVVVATLSGFQLSREMYEAPSYEVLERSGDLEVRRYSPRIVAQTVVETADRRQAASEGFGRLAGYIFGKNRDGAGSKDTIKMTVPVESTPTPVPGERIAMTTPVTSTAERAGRWVITFTMPSHHTLASLPKPLDTRVELSQLPATTVAAITFYGKLSPELRERKEHELREALSATDYVVNGPVSVAQFDPPWVLSIFRKNEVYVPVELNR